MIVHLYGEPISHQTLFLYSGSRRVEAKPSHEAGQEMGGAFSEESKPQGKRY